MTGSSGNSSESSSGSEIEEIENAIDRFLSFLAKVWEIIVIIAIIGLLILFRATIWSQLKSRFSKVCKACRWRTFKRCLIYTFCCGCFDSVHRQLGFEKMNQAQTTLTVTFLFSQAIKKRLTFYYEAWTEPQESACKNTNTFTGSEVVDMGAERLELDWFGDEDELVVQLMEFKSSAPGQNLILGEVRIPASVVEKYAREAADDLNDFSLGARCFDVKELEQSELWERTHARKNPTNPLPKMVKKGVDILNESKFGEEVKTLRDENKRLKEQLTQANQTLSARSLGTVLKVVMRFEKTHRKKGHFNMEYRSSSFDEHTQNSTIPNA